MNIIEMIKTRKAAAISSMAIAAVLLILGIVTSVRAYASEDYWDLKAGEETIAVFNTKEEAEAVIDEVKNGYVVEGSELIAIECEPELSVVQTTYKTSEKPELADPEKVADYIFTGTKEPVVYTVQESESFYSIAENNGFTVDELMAMNPDKDPELIYPGDTLNLYQMKPLVVVTTKQIVTSEKEIEFETEEKETADLTEGTTEVEQEGENGLAKVTELIETDNGVLINSEVQNSETIKEPVKKVVLVGTAKKAAARSASSGWTGADAATFSGDGNGIAAFARQFVGCPYVYGGTSLSGGSDCSGFVMSVFGNFGIGLPHNATAMRNYGRGVSLGEALPGDIICNPGHVGIYIGGGMMVHAVNERLGVAVTSVGYVGPVVTVRRIVE